MYVFVIGECSAQDGCNATIVDASVWLVLVVCNDIVSSRHVFGEHVVRLPSLVFTTVLRKGKPCFRHAVALGVIGIVSEDGPILNL